MGIPRTPMTARCAAFAFLNAAMSAGVIPLTRTLDMLAAEEDACAMLTPLVQPLTESQYRAIQSARKGTR